MNDIAMVFYGSQNVFGINILLKRNETIKYNNETFYYKNFFG